MWKISYTATNPSPSLQKSILYYEEEWSGYYEEEGPEIDLLYLFWLMSPLL